MKPKKHLGQHFLRDKHIVLRIVEALEATPGDHVLEIGPGPGTLTFPLHERGYRLTAVDPDTDMIAHLEEHGFEPPITLIEADFMDVPLERVIQGETRVISNLPYNVSVPITARLLEASDRIPTMVLMYQKEVADRIRAAPDNRDYGPISVLCRMFYDIDMAFNVKPGSFFPPPKVMSAVIRLRRLKEPLLDLNELSRCSQLVRFLFTHRRKMLGARLKKWSGDWTSAQTLLESLTACGLDPKARPENLEPAAYAAWFRQVEGAR